MPAINLNNATTTYAKIAASASVVDLIAENGNRVGLFIANNSTNILYIRIDADATTSDYTFALASNTIFTMPLNYFTDKVTGIWDGTNGFARVTQIAAR